MLVKALKYLLRSLLINLDSLFTSSAIRKDGILLVRLDAIGDFLVWSHSAKEYRNLFPGQKITLIVNPLCNELALSLPYWDEVWTVDSGLFTKNVFYRWKMLRKISKAGFSIAIQPTYSRLFLHGDSIIKATRAKIRLGSAGDLSRITAAEKAISDRWYTQLLPATFLPLMELERNAEFLSNLRQIEYIPRINLLPPLKELPRKLQIQQDYYIIFPGASWSGRQWPVNHFARVMEQISHQFGWQPVICGSKQEQDLCREVSVAAMISSLNFSGETTLPDLVELIRGAKLLIANETSAIHIAAAVGTPSVCILGGGHYGRFMPYPETIQGIKPLMAVKKMPCFNCNWNCNQPHDPIRPVPCIDAISVDSVLNLATYAIESGIYSKTV